MTNEQNTGCVLAVAGAGLLMIAVAGILFGWPLYRVWAARHDGEATLARAESTNRVMIEQAKAEVESAKLRAEAIALVGKAAKEFPEYRHQEFIAAFAEALHEGNVQQIIYVPTEANVPIVESFRKGIPAK